MEEGLDDWKVSPAQSTGILLTGILLSLVMLGRIVYVTHLPSPALAPRLSVAKPWLHPNRINLEKIRGYAAEVKLLAADPGPLAAFTSSDLGQFQLQISGAHTPDRLPPTEWDELKENEAILEARIIAALQSRIDPSVDMKRVFQASYPPYEPGINLLGQPPVASEAEYEERVQLEIDARKKWETQRGLQRSIGMCTEDAQNYLSKNYPDLGALVAIWKTAGIDQKTIDTLTRPAAWR